MEDGRRGVRNDARMEDGGWRMDEKLRMEEKSRIEDREWRMANPKSKRNKRNLRSSVLNSRLSILNPPSSILDLQIVSSQNSTTLTARGAKPSRKRRVFSLSKLGSAAS